MVTYFGLEDWLVVDRKIVVSFVLLPTKIVLYNTLYRSNCNDTCSIS